MLLLEATMRRTVINVRAAAVLFPVDVIVSLCWPQMASATTQMTATVGVNIRSGSSTNTDILGGLFRGQTVTAISSSQGWTKISYDGSTAYVASRYLTKGKDLPPPLRIGPGTVKVTTTALNLRTGPGLSYSVIKVLKGGARVTMTGKTARGWAQLVNGRSTGWSSMQYLVSSMYGRPTIIGKRVATADLDVRTTSGTDSRTVTEVKKGIALSVTGAIQNGRAQIIYESRIRWVTARYLTKLTSNLPSPPRLPKIIGTRYATAALDIRSTYADKYRLITEVPRGTELKITGVVRNGRMQIIFDKAVRWVTATYLSKSAPSSIPSSWLAVERGLKPNAIAVHRAMRARFPQITVYGGVRPSVIPDHEQGRALDSMIPDYRSASGKALGDEAAAWAKANARSLGINYVIWNQHIWNITRDSEGWRYMADRGSDSANHLNHIHITVFADGLDPR
ncbi:MAG TPA: SH3 domain-containing protein [Propionibacteriaceae bacterium]|nr:SH3 domain-containing protein [Propionibacteriaceae bacterium]